MAIAHVVISRNKNKRSYSIIMCILAKVSLAVIRMNVIAQRVTSDKNLTNINNKHSPGGTSL